MLELGVIADDLTGGLMVASLLEREGVCCPLVTSAGALDGLDNDAEAVVVGCRLRLAAPSQAAAEARSIGEALLGKQAKRLYYKYSALFMSTEQGNIGPVSEALMELTEAGRVLFCPQWGGVTVYMGRAFVNQVMLHECGASRDPVTPMTNSNLVEVLQAQSQAKVGFLPLATMRGDNLAAEAYLAEQASKGTKFFVADGINQDTDVTRIAELCLDAPLSTGADGLPVYLARAWQQGRQKPEPQTLLPPAPGYVAVLAGSCSNKTNQQLELFEQQPVAYWNDGELLNVRGDAFQAGPVTQLGNLPNLAGPKGSGSEVLAELDALQSQLGGLGLNVSQLRLEPRGAWRFQVNDSVWVMLGRNDREARLARFMAAWQRRLGDEASQIRYIDLRYPNGVAVAWHGETTAPEEGKGS